MPRGRRPAPGTAEEKAALRRERVRLNVQAFRKRKAGELGQQDAGKSSIRWAPESKWQAEYDQYESKDTENESLIAPSTASSEAIPDDQVRAFSLLPKTPDLAKQYSHGLLASLPARFLPHRVSIPTIPNGFIKIRTPCALWVTSACNLAQTQDHGPLKDSLLSIVLALASVEEKRPELGVMSHRLYSRSLTKTRRVLQPIIESSQVPAGADIAGVFLACHAASVFELFINGSLEDMLRHVNGIGFLIQHLQSQSDISELNSAIGDSLLEEYRMLQMNFCMMNRQPSTIHQSKMKMAEPGTSVFTDLLDIADQIPSIMVEIDALRPKQINDPSACAKRLKVLIPNLLNLHNQLENWSAIFRQQLVDKSLDHLFNESRLDTSAILSYEFASTWMFSCSYDSYAIETSIEAFEFLADVEKALGSQDSTTIDQRVKQLRSGLVANSGGIVDIMPYFLQPDKGIIGRSIAIWPLEAAWSTLENELKRLDRDGTDFSRVGAQSEVATQVQERKFQVMKYLKLCRETETAAISYGLPILTSRKYE